LAERQKIKRGNQPVMIEVFFRAIVSGCSSGLCKESWDVEDPKRERRTGESKESRTKDFREWSQIPRPDFVVHCDPAEVPEERPKAPEATTASNDQDQEGRGDRRKRDRTLELSSEDLDRSQRKRYRYLGEDLSTRTIRINNLTVPTNYLNKMLTRDIRGT
jgi:hypothetical protein